MGTIEKLSEKIKRFNKTDIGRTILWGIIFCCFGISSFFLGGIYERQQIREETPVELEYSQEAVDLWNSYQASKFSNTQFFASKNGTVVYPVGCSKGNRIKDENKVFFNTLEQAIDAGYRLAEGC
tara:strand:- start:2363 stop:2737 length:375 start_codon:yes stop_codon:yes gene_type:complete